MSELPRNLPPEFWIAEVFAAKSVADGGVIRRKIRDVERICGRDRFLWEVRRRGFHAVENGENIIVFCNDDPLRILV